MRSIFFALGLLLSTVGLSAQIVRDAVSWTRSVEDKSPTEKVLVFTAQVKGEWHLYRSP